MGGKECLNVGGLKWMWLLKGIGTTFNKSEERIGKMDVLVIVLEE